MKLNLQSDIWKKLNVSNVDVIYSFSFQNYQMKQTVSLLVINR
jgi:hypothetical protein